MNLSLKLRGTTGANALVLSCLGNAGIVPWQMPSLEETTS